jgi:hypothetical protein
MVVLSTVAAAAPARADAVLRWKFTPGETLHYVIQQKIVQKVKMGVTPITMTMTQRMDMSWEVEKVDAKGVASAKHTMTRIQMKMESSQGVMLDYDSASGTEPEGIQGKMLGPVFQAMVNKPISMKMSPRGEISDIQVPQAMIDGFSKLPGMDKIGSTFFESFAKQPFGLGMMPEEAVAPGDTWKEEMEVAMPMMGSMKAQQTYEYLGSEARSGKELEKLRVGLQLDFAAGEEKPAISMKVTEQDTSGTAWFDNVAGRLAETETKSKMKMEITVADMTMESDMEMDAVLKLQPAASSEEAAPKQ